MAYDIVKPSAVEAGATGQSPNFVAPKDQSLRAELNVTASSGPTTLDVRIQHSNDGGATWVTIGSFAQVGAVATAQQSISIPAPHSGLLRVDWSKAGTSYTFSVSIRRE